MELCALFVSQKINWNNAIWFSKTFSMDVLLTNDFFMLCFHIKTFYILSNLALLSILAVVQFLIVDNFPLQLSNV